MGFWGRLFKGDKLSWQDDNDRSLVDPPKGDRRRKKEDAAAAIELTPWSATRLAAIFQELAKAPSGKVIGEARRARLCISRFWLQAPVDQLEGLYRSPVGQCYRLLLKTELPAMPLLTEEQQWRDGLARRLSKAMNRPESVNLLLAAMPFFERGKMRLMNATDVVPQWLIGDYSALFDPGLARLLSRPAGYLGPAGTAAAGRAIPPQQLQARGTYGMAGGGQPGPGLAPQQGMAPPQQAMPQQQQPMPLPVMAQRRGNDALALLQNQDYLGRMSGLINLYTIDPNDAEVKRELIGLRRQMGQIWLDLNPTQLQALYQTPFGQLYRNFLGCGFSREPLIPEDQQLRGELARYVGNMAQPLAINALLAALPFFTPGRIQFGGGEQFIPPWLLADIQALNGQAMAGQGVAGGQAMAAR